eukprot:m.426907 g.426907  ORF g.426907 m.426907 type:complete len:113 (-) comp60884_c0_seq1:819-1157(-)
MLRATRCPALSARPSIALRTSMQLWHKRATLVAVILVCAVPSASGKRSSNDDEDLGKLMEMLIKGFMPAVDRGERFANDPEIKKMPRDEQVASLIRSICLENAAVGGALAGA